MGDTNKSIVEESINPVKNTVVSDPKPSYQSSSKRLLPLPKVTEDGRVSNVYRGKDSQGKVIELSFEEISKKTNKTKDAVAVKPKQGECGNEKSSITKSW